MSNSMSWRVQKVETAVFEPVDGLEIGNAKTGAAEVDLTDTSAFKCILCEHRIWIRWIAWQKGLLEARANDKACASGKATWVANVVEVAVRQDNPIDCAQRNVVLCERLRDVFRCVDLDVHRFDGFRNC